MSRPRLGVFKFASCDGCQLTLLDCEDELLAVDAAVDIAYFPEARRLALQGQFDVSIVEGSVSAPAQLEELLDIRKRSRFLVSIGACATAGGVQALRNLADSDEFIRAVYATPDYIRTLATSTPIAAHVPVDFQLRGCPISKAHLLELIVSLLRGRRPQLPDESVCVECKRRGIVCVMVARGEPCLGPVTHGGCGALCPDFRRACYGCFGPKESCNTKALAARLRAQDRTGEQVAQLFEKFNVGSRPFKDEAARQRGDRS
ncbi:MAG: oxidoreductase [Candidatus Wallbacteria bacterium]|nr:oxidoreductase [Candidatus Wallbacteria bacterium]